MPTETPHDKVVTIVSMLKTAIDGKAGADHTHSSIVDGNTTVSAVNGGTATITKTGTGNASVTFPAGFSITYYGETYSTSDGETIEFVGPYSVDRYSYWVPSDTQNPESFDPSQNSVWCLYSSGPSATEPERLMFGTSIDYVISDWDTAAPSLTINNGEASGGAPAMARDLQSTKTVATTDQIPASFDRIVSQDGSTSVIVNDDGTATLEVAGATIGDNDPLSDLADYLGLGDNATLDDVRQALGLSVDATLEDAVQAVPASYDKTIATLDDLEPKLDSDQRNIVPYAASADLTLDPEVAVYRLSPTGTAIAIPTPVTTALTATDGYYQFEIELAVPATATSLTAPSGWTWLTGFELPMSGYAGRTVYVSCRMDLRRNAVTASCWRVA